MATKGKLKCNRCFVCNGYGCKNNLPGLGGVFNNQNFQLNCSSWENLRKLAQREGYLNEIENIEVLPSQIKCGPVTGAVENIGYNSEEDFYFPYLKAAKDAGFGLCVGDGYPDIKLQFGFEAVKRLNTKAAFFFKPYPFEKLVERVNLVKNYAEYIGIDIDSYNIVTMRNLVNLEKKTSQQLEEFRKLFNVPLVIKGVFTEEDIQLCKELRPDVIYISNHGGRVETRIGSTGDFLAKYSKSLKNYCKEIWVDGGIRCKEDVQTALFYGADKVIAARPFIRAVFDEEVEELSNFC